MVAVRGEPTLVRIGDLAGRTRGVGFLADTVGTVVTSHEAVDGLNRAVVQLPGNGPSTAGSWLAEAGDITALPAWDLALVRTEGLSAPPVVLGAERARPEGTRVRVWVGEWLDARLTGTARVTYTSTERYHPLEGVLELALPEAAAAQLRLSRQVSGAPVLDADTGAVLGVLGTALHPGQRRTVRGAGYAVPLRAAALWEPDGPLAVPVARNGATVPGFGADLNLAGALQLTATSVAGAVERAGHPVERPEVADAFRDFETAATSVAALVGVPGSGRTTELAMLAARRARGAAPTPTVWLRGAELCAGDGGVRDAVARALVRAGRIVAAAGGVDPAGSGGPPVGDPREVNPDVVARLARDAGRPLMVLLDAPEEMPPRLARELRRWTAGTAGWLRAAGARMVLACGPEYWERAGAHYPPAMLYGERPGGGCAPSEVPPPRVAFGALQPRQAARARARYGLPNGALTSADAAHPLALRMLSEVRAALGGPVVPGGAADSGAEHTACTAEHHGPPPQVAMDGPAAGESWRGSGPAAAPYESGTAPVPGIPQLPESAGAGSTPRAAAADDVQPDRTGNARLHQHAGPTDPAEHAGNDWPWNGCWDAAATHQGAAAHGAAAYEESAGPPSRVELFDAYLGLVSLRIAVRLAAGGLSPASGGGAVRRLAARAAGQLHEAARRCLGPGEGALEREAFEELFPWGGGWASAVLGEGTLVPAGDGYRFADGEFADWLQGQHLELDAALDTLVHRPAAEHNELYVPRHRAGPVVQALLLCGRSAGPAALARRLHPLVAACGAAGEAGWWAGWLLSETLLRVPDARPYHRVLRALAERVATLEEAQPALLAGESGRFRPAFWRRLALPDADLLELLRILLPADGAGATPGSLEPVDGAPPPRADRFLDLAGTLLAARPSTVQPVLCDWFSDQRPLWQGREDKPAPTVAEAAQALLYTHRRRATDALTEVLADAAHPRADELLAELARDEPSALCRAVDRWVHDERTERRATAALLGERAARHVRAGTDRELLRYAGVTLLRRADAETLRGPALAMLVRDPVARERHLDAAVRQFTRHGGRDLAGALGATLATHPAAVLVAFRDRLRGVGAGSHGRLSSAAAREVPALLAEAGTPEAARRVALLVCGYAELCPDQVAEVAAGFLRRALQRQTPGVAVHRLVAELLHSGQRPLREALAAVLGGAVGTLRDGLVEELFAVEQDPEVLGAVLCAAVRDGDGQQCDGELVRRAGVLMRRTGAGAADLDQRLAELAREVPGFAERLRGWADGACQEWVAVVGPEARQTCAAYLGQASGQEGSGGV